jgi:hypothetical protein
MVTTITTTKGTESVLSPHDRTMVPEGVLAATLMRRQETWAS